MPVATITLETDDDSVVISAPNDEFIDDDIILDTAPDGIYDTGFTIRTQSGAFEIGGRIIGQEVPIRQMTLPFWLSPSSRPRFQKLWGTPGNFKKVRWHYDGPSGRRSLTLKLAKQIAYETEDGHDAAIDDVYHAVVVALAVNPMYESAEDIQEWENPSLGTNTGYFSVWNPTDQPLWLEWTFDPATSWSFPDFSFGQERQWGRTAGADAARMIVTPALTQMLSVMADPMMDTYVNADLSNAAGLFNGVEPLYAVPPYTANEASPIVVPITCNGPAGAKATLRMRRYWSAESGLEQ